VKKAASVLLKLFINNKERCHTTDAPSIPGELCFQMLTTYNPLSHRIRKMGSIAQLVKEAAW